MQSREYFYTINEYGDIIHDNCIIDDAKFLAMMYKNMEINSTDKHTDYSYLSTCGNEILYCKPVDTPIIFKQYQDSMLLYQGGSVPMQPDQLAFSNKGILYHRAPIGSYGRISANVAIELSKNISEWGRYYAYHTPDMKFPRILEPLDNLTIRLLHPKEKNTCFGCGIANPAGLGLTFVFNKDKKIVESWFKPNQMLMGALNTMHGGFVSLLLDEAMGKVLSGLQVKAPTAQLNVRFRKPTLLQDELYIVGKLNDIQGRKHFLHAFIHNSFGEVTAEAEALFIKISDTATY